MYTNTCMYNMLGFPKQGALEAKKHLDRLVERVPEKYHPELHVLYDWVTDGAFQAALREPRTENWKYCKESMPTPPFMYIDKQLETSLAGPLLEVKYPEVKGIRPSCRLCEEALAGNVEEKVKHVVITCSCGRMYCHKKCADDYLLKEAQCYICKNYYIYDLKNSGLIATIAGQI